jgi:two-component system sensor histidine kinase UhpB
VPERAAAADSDTDAETVVGLDWLASRVPVSAEGLKTHRLALGDATLQLRPDPRSEVREIVRDAGRTFLILLLFCLATVAAAWMAAHRALGPVRQLELALAGIARGEVGGPMPHFELREFERIARAVEAMSTSLAQAQASQRQLTRQLLAVQESERRELAAELHDEIGQSLTAIGVSAAFVDRHAEQAPPATLRDCARDIRSQSQRISGQVRGMLRRLRPHGLEDLGVQGAVSELIDGWRQRGGLQIHSELSPQLPRLSPLQALTVYRTVQEALTNVQRHTAATSVEVRLWSDAPEQLQLRICDDGGGVAAEVRARRGGGLFGMDERARMSGGTLSLTQGPQGLAVNLALQLQREGHVSLADAAEVDDDEEKQHHDSHPVGR